MRFEDPATPAPSTSGLPPSENASFILERYREGAAEVADVGREGKSGRCTLLWGEKITGAPPPVAEIFDEDFF